MRPLILFLFGAGLALSGCQEAPPATEPSAANQPASGSPDASQSIETVQTRTVSFSQRVQALCDTLFPEYREQELSPVDKMPRFPRANQSLYRQFRRSKPVRIEINPRVYPRVTLKAFRFADAKTADRTVDQFLNGHEHSRDTIVIGHPVEAFKSPPHFCAVLGSQFILLQTSCLYQHPTYDEMRKRFFAWVEGQADVRYTWEVTCEAGKIDWRVTP